MKVSVLTLGGLQAEVEAEPGWSGDRLLNELGELARPGIALKLVHGEDAVDARATLEANGIIDGDELTLVRSRMDVSVAVGFKDGSGALWAAETGELKHELKGHWGPISSLEFSPDGRSVLTTSADKSARVWSVADGACRRSLSAGGSLAAAVCLPEDKVLTVSTNMGVPRTLRLWSAETGRCVRVYNDIHEMFGARCSKDGHAMVTVARAVRLWNLDTGKCMFCFDGHGDAEVTCTQISNDRSLVVTAAADGTVKLWNTESGHCDQDIKAHKSSVLCVEISPDGLSFVTTSDDGESKLWSTTTGECRRSFRLLQQGAPAPTFSSCSKYLSFVAEDGTAQVWSTTSTDHCLHAFRCPEGRASRTMFSPDGSQLLTLSGPGSVRLWDLSSGEELYTLTCGAAVSDVSIGWTREW